MVPNSHSGDPFSMESLTAAINAEPYRPGQIGRLGLFEEDGVNTIYVSIERRDGKLALVEPSARGGAGETTSDEERSKVLLQIPHYQRDDSVLADEVQNVRAFGSETDLETLVSRIQRKQARHGQDLTMTLEHQRVGAIKGNVTSKSGTVLANLYTQFGIAVPAAVSLELDQTATDVGELFSGVRHSIEDSLEAPYDGLHVFTGRSFHAAMWKHKSVRETFMFEGTAQILRNGAPDVFEFGGAVFERYRTGAKAASDLGSQYIADDKARVVPVGVPELFITRFGPADYNETVNTVGLPFYSRLSERSNGKGFDLDVQMNAISICTRPEVLRELTLT